jgi:predicted MFS family arabinose efflux permease
LLLVAGSLVFIAISKATSTFALLTLGRLLIGLYTGIGCALVPIYVQELSPHQLKVRGNLSFESNENI